MTTMETLQDVFNRSSLKEEDHIQYAIYLPNKEKDMILYLQDTINMINSMIEPTIKDYLWQKDRFHLSIVQDKSQDPLYPFLYGISRFGDCINDEWFIVHLLHQISITIPESIISISDNDGDVLLIEAALELPSWLDPSNSQNRVYLHRGQLHIIPLPNSPSDLLQLPASLTREKAIDIIRSNPQASIADPAIQSAIRDRISGYPAAAVAEIHRANCLLPNKAAFVLLKEPQLITLAVEAFYLRDPLSMKACTSMNTFPPSEGNILTTVRFTRTTYAQTVSQKFYAPKPFRLPAARETRKFKYAELGMKVACGLEMLYRQSKDSNEARSIDDVESDKKFTSYLDHLSKLGYFRGEKKGSRLYNALEAKAKEQYLIYKNEERSKVISVDHPDADDEDIVKPSIENVRARIDQVLSQYTEEELNKIVEANTDQEDSDDWMNIDPQQLEELLFKRMAKDNDMLKDLGRSVEDESSMNLEAIMSNLQHFVESGKSGLEGVEISKDIYGSDDDDNDDDDDVEESELKFDYERFMRILQGKDVNDNNEEDMHNVMEEMDQEIYGYDKLKNSFEKMPLEEDEKEDEDAPVDIELNLVKNILESFKSQQGLPGPAGNMLNQFGIVLPRDEEEEE
ncbi:Putative SGT1-like protein [Rhizopus microsporus]|nr:Putative SGT1-like protein [Rhizopus microsporus]